MTASINKIIGTGLIALGLGIFFQQTVHADTILVFSQVGVGQTVTGSNSGSGSTALAINDVRVSVGGYAGTAGDGFFGYMDLSASSSGIASLTGSGDITQQFIGSFCITSLIGCGGTNYLSGSFTGVFTGKGNSATFYATTPPSGSVTFSADPAQLSSGQLGIDRAFSLSFTNLTPSLSISGNSVSSFTSNVSGNMSANQGQVPEPASVALMGLGIAAMAAFRRRGRRT